MTLFNKCLTNDFNGFFDLLVWIYEFEINKSFGFGGQTVRFWIVCGLLAIQPANWHYRHGTSTPGGSSHLAMIDINVFVLVNILRLGVNKSPIQMTNDANTLESKTPQICVRNHPPKQKTKENTSISVCGIQPAN